MNALFSESFARWRKTKLGELTELIETNLVLDLTGQLSSRRVLDVGCGDGTWAAWRRARGWLGSSTCRRARFRTARELAYLARSAGLDVDRGAGAIYYPPVGSVARFLAPLDVTLGAITTLGAAFVAVAARK